MAENNEKISMLQFMCPEFYLENTSFHSFLSQDNKWINDGISLWDHFIDLNGNNIKDENESYGKSRIISPEWKAKLIKKVKKEPEYSVQKNKISCYPINRQVRLQAKLKVNCDFFTSTESNTI